MFSNKDSDIDIGNIEEFFENDMPIFNKLSEQQKNNLEQELSLEEISQALKETNNNSAPGGSGLTYAFYKCFWGSLNHFVLQTFNFSYSSKRLPTRLSHLYITLLPKGDKPKDKIANWRPITLLDCLYKILSKTIATRIKTVLADLIHPDQCGFVNDRYIGEAVRCTADVIEYARVHNKEGLILLIDFKKAFDSVGHAFIEKCLEFFGFGPIFRKWISLLLKDFKGIINHGGNLSKMFPMNRGVCQGDPVSSLLFILCVEILSIRLRASTKITGYVINDFRILLQLYADDCKIVLNYRDSELRESIRILDMFYRLSGLQIHLNKTQCVKLGRHPERMRRICYDIDLAWGQSFRLLGVTINADTLNYDENIHDKIDDINKTAGNWRHRFLTPLGRICIAKTLLLSKLNHLAFLVPNIGKKTMRDLNSNITKFIWRGSPKVAREDAILEWAKGGINMPDIKSSWACFKLSWFRRLYNSQGAWTKLYSECLRELGIEHHQPTEFHLLTFVEIKMIANRAKMHFGKRHLKL